MPTRSAASTMMPCAMRAPAADLVGYLNYIHPYRVQIVGRREVAYFKASKRRRPRAPHLPHRHPGAARHHRRRRRGARQRLAAMCDRADIPLFVTQESAGHVIDVLRAYLEPALRRRAPRATASSWTSSGVGVLHHGRIRPGQERARAGARSRAGNGLVADDAVDLYRVSQTAIEGPLPGTADEPAGGPRHRPAGHSRPSSARPPCGARCA
jgi:HPr kinase/phosphorylase